MRRTFASVTRSQFLVLLFALTAAPILPARGSQVSRPEPSRLQAPSGDSLTVPRRPRARPLSAALQGLVINIAVNRYNAWVRDESWAGVSPSSWRRNLRLGWEWDEDTFGTNAFEHPNHGGWYFNAARANGLNFWEAAPMTFLGSWMWEYFAETAQPSLNDFIMTSFGGITLGETFYRVATSIRDNTARGSGRILREVAALPLDPIGGINRLVRGEWRKVGANPSNRDPGAFGLHIYAGLRTRKDSVGATNLLSGSIMLDLLYGDPFQQPYRDPFDVMSVRLQASTDAGLYSVRASGRLFGRNLNSRDATHRHLFAVGQRYDYVSNPSQRFGAQSIEVGVHSRWKLPLGLHLQTQIFADVVMMGAMDAPSSGTAARNYDFGPGLGFRTEFSFEHDGVTYLTLHGRRETLHTVSGARANHTAEFAGIDLSIPITRGIGIALQSGEYVRRSRYSHGVDDVRTSPETRVSVVWASGDRVGLGPPR